MRYLSCQSLVGGIKALGRWLIYSLQQFNGFSWEMVDIFPLLKYGGLVEKDLFAKKARGGGNHFPLIFVDEERVMATELNFNI